VPVRRLCTQLRRFENGTLLALALPSVPIQAVIVCESRASFDLGNAYFSELNLPKHAPALGRISALGEHGSIAGSLFLPAGELAQSPASAGGEGDPSLSHPSW